MQKVIVTDENHEEMLKRLEDLILADKESDAEEMDMLAEAIEEYEREAFPIPEVPGI